MIAPNLQKTFKNIIASAYVILVFLFAYTGVDKLLNHDIFYAHLIVFPFINQAAGVLSWMVPLTEIIASVLLVIPYTRNIGLWMCLILLMLFTIYLTVMITSGVELPCSCGGVINFLSWKQHILFNLFFIALDVIILKYSTATAGSELKSYTPSKSFL